MHYLVTGGCGFIGSHLCETLARAGHELTVLDDLSTGKREQLPRGSELIVGDIADGATVHRAMQGKDGCFHLAAIASVERSRLEPERTHAVNYIGTAHVIDAAIAAGKIPVVYASSAAVYGDNPELPLNEAAVTRPLSAYGEDKLAGERYAFAAAGAYRLPSTGLRFFNCYGPRQDPASPYSGVISIFASRIRRGEPVTIFGDGEQTRDFVYVGDVAAHLSAAMRALESGKLTCEALNVCTGKATRLLTLVETLNALCGKAVAPQFAPARGGDIRHSLGDPAMAKEKLGLSARIELAAGLTQLLHSLEHGS